MRINKGKGMKEDCNPRQQPYLYAWPMECGDPETGGLEEVKGCIWGALGAATSSLVFSSTGDGSH